MKSLTFDEFFGLPAGTIFGQVGGVPHQLSTGLYCKGRSHPGGDGEAPNFSAVDLLFLDDDGDAGVTWPVWSGETGEGHRFLVYEAEDVDRLAALLGVGPDSPR